jgi:hypothetical protein
LNAKEARFVQVIEKSIHALKKGNLFAVINVSGKRGDKLDLKKQGFNSKLLFFHEEPSNGIECSYFQGENLLELGGPAMETNRTIYLVVGNTESEAEPSE